MMIRTGWFSQTRLIDSHVSESIGMYIAVMGSCRPVAIQSAIMCSINATTLRWWRLAAWLGYTSRTVQFCRGGGRRVLFSQR